MRKLMTSTIILLPLLLLAIMLVSGAIMSIVTHIYVESVEFVENETLVLVMKNEQTPPSEKLEVTILPFEAENRDLVFTVEDESIASVDETGKITAKYFGETVVTVASKENTAASAKRKVRVTDSTVHALSIGAFENDMYQGETQRFFAEVLPVEATNKQVTWSSSDESILSVTQNGDVTCHRAGTATITATSVEKPEISASAEVRCHEALISISVGVSSVVTAKKTEQFPTLSVTPSVATYSVEYESSDEEVATVDSSGKIQFHRAGSVVLTANATDARQNHAKVSVPYIFTDGYYVGALFETARYVIDYDANKGKTLDEIRLLANPEGSYRQIEEVTFEKDGVPTDMISFDEETNQFRLKNVGDTEALGTIRVTIKALKFDLNDSSVKEFVTDGCEIILRRNVGNISFYWRGMPIESATITEQSISFSETLAEHMIGVSVTPLNHTNHLSYQVLEGPAVFAGTTLSFTEAGTARIQVTAKDDEGSVILTAEVEITYHEPESSERIIEVTKEMTHQQISLMFYRNGSMETGFLNIVEPLGWKATIGEIASDVVRLDDNSLTILKGGFATVNITFEDESGAEAPVVCTVEIYADRQMDTSDITFNLENDSYTAKDQVEGTITLNVPEGAMEGKELWLNGNKLTKQPHSQTYSFSQPFASGMSDLSLTASIKYAEEVQTYAKKEGFCVGECCSPKEVMVHTTRGNLLSQPKVSYRDTKEEIQAGDTLHFKDLGAQIVLTIDTTNPNPSDFELVESMISFSSMVKFSFEVLSVENQIATISLTASASVSGSDTTILKVAGQSLELKIEIPVIAHKIEVKYGTSALQSGKEYTTLLSSLDFMVTLSRNDGYQITDTDVQCLLNDQPLSNLVIAGTSGTLSLSLNEKENVLVLKSGDAEFRITLRKLELSEMDFRFHIEYTENGSLRVLDEFECDGTTKEFTFPQAMMGTFDIVISYDLTDSLGGMDFDAMKKFFTFDKNNEWGIEFSASAKITITVGNNYFLDEKITLHSGTKTVELLLNRIDLVTVEMPGFDYKTDNYAGYQQVRVFAKHSDYGDGTVDYFSVPIQAYKNVDKDSADLDSITWKLTRYVGNSAEKELIIQRGTKLIYQGEEYVIEKGSAGTKSTLKKKDGTTIAQNGTYQAGQTKVPWVDLYATEGSAEIYFGNFAGLEEKDIQNDYFGNFAELKNWTQTPTALKNKDDENDQRDVTPSANAYAYLKAEVGDGAKDSSANTHFNFNVLNDDSVVNVFNATGYYNHNKVVLQENLYGKDETLPEGTDDSQVLSQSSNVAKTTIYGNGHQVNLQAYNEELPNKNESQYIQFDNLYNVKMMGANANSELNQNNQKVYFYTRYLYYCDMQYYWKLTPKEASETGRLYVKNTVFSCVAKTAIQLYYSQSLYAENITIVECGAGISVEFDTGSPGNAESKKKNAHIYFKGDIDILDYNNKTGLNKMTNNLIGLLFGEVITGIKDYLEWHGKTIPEVNATMGSDEIIDRYYVNVLIYSTYSLEGKVFSWNEETGSYEKGSSTLKLQGNRTIVNKCLAFNAYFAWTYDYKNTLEGGTITVSGNGPKITADRKSMNDIFTDQRYIRLLCEYKEPGVKNVEHIQWHMNQVYRDTALLVGREDHITNLKKTLAGVVWPDSTTADSCMG